VRSNIKLGLKKFVLKEDFNQDTYLIKLN